MDSRELLQVVFPDVEMERELVPDIRYLRELRGLTLKEVPLKDEPVYYMYRSLYIDGDREIFEGNKIRHDITVIPPKSIEGEFIKTAGHFHPLRNEKETYPEYYEVLKGEALYLLQKNNGQGDVEEVVFVKAQAGDKVFVPPNYGHITINCSEETLVMANLVEANFKSLYEPIAKKKGPAYFCIQANEGVEFIFNENYTNRVEPKVVSAQDWEDPIEVEQGKRLYEMYVEDPGLFEFLK